MAGDIEVAENCAGACGTANHDDGQGGLIVAGRCLAFVMLTVIGEQYPFAAQRHG